MRHHYHPHHRLSEQIKSQNFSMIRSYYNALRSFYSPCKSY